MNAIKDAAGNALASPFAQSFKVLYGDFNGDGVVSSADMLGVYYAVSQPYNIFADLNGDGVVNTTDVQIARSRIGAQL
jgi:Dockerin type I domain